MSVLWRRKLFFLPALVLALVITGGLFESVKPTYSAVSTVLLTNPTNPPSNSAPADKGIKFSPFYLYNDLNTVAAIVSDAESSPSAQQEFLKKDDVPKTGYTVTPDPTGDSPELIITTTSVVPGQAMTWNQKVTADVQNFVTNFQNASHTSPATFVQTSVLTTPTNPPLKSDKSRLRVGIAVGVVTVLLAISMTLIFDSVMTQRSSRRRRATTLPVVSQSVGDGEFYTGGSIASMHGSESRGRTSALRRP